MEFWGIEVKAGQSFKVQPDDDQVIHISQASLGESKKGKGDSVPLYVKFGDQKLVLGTLSSDKFPQISFDLVFEKEFELSHNWSGGSVYFMGYKSVLGDDEDHEHSDFDSEDDIPIPGRVELAPVPLKEVKAKATKKSEKPNDSSIADMDEDDSEDDDFDNDSVEDDEGSDESDSDDAEDDSSEDDEETPKKPEVSKKRPNEAAAAKTPDTKKAKLTTPQKTDGKKKEVHTATPHPKKQEGKTDSKKAAQSPKSGGQVSCGTCSKTFNSETGLQSHTKAKHSGGK